MLLHKLHVENFDQRLGAAHPKCWLKYAFLTFLMVKSSKKEKKARNKQKNLTNKFFFCLHQNTGRVFYSQIKQVFSYFPTSVLATKHWLKYTTIATAYYLVSSSSCFKLALSCSSWSMRNPLDVNLSLSIMLVSIKY